MRAKATEVGLTSQGVLESLGLKKGNTVAEEELVQLAKEAAAATAKVVKAAKEVSSTVPKDKQKEVKN